MLGLIPASAPSEFTFLGKTSFARDTVTSPVGSHLHTVCDAILPQFHLSIKHNLRLAA